MAFRDFDALRAVVCLTLLEGALVEGGAHLKYTVAERGSHVQCALETKIFLTRS